MINHKQTCFRKLALLIAVSVVPIALSACVFFGNAKTDLSPGFYDAGERPGENEYTRYDTFDLDELSLQIQEFERYREMNAALTDGYANDIEEYGFSVMSNSEYVVGRDIEPGVYFVKLADGADSATISLDRGEKLFLWYHLSDETSRHRYVRLLDGDIFDVTDEDVIPADARNHPAMTARDGVYLEGVYSVPVELPPGDYFALQMKPIRSRTGTGGVVTDSSDFCPNRFGYIRISESDTFAQLSDCVLIPAEKKPEVSPVAKEDGDYYGQGMYKIGVDIPLGTYAIRPDLFIIDYNFTYYDKDSFTYYSEPATHRSDTEWNRTVFDWLGYWYYDEGINQSYAVELGQLSETKPVLRILGKFSVRYERFEDEATVTLDRPGEYIELIKIGLAEMNPPDS